MERHIEFENENHCTAHERIDLHGNLRLTGCSSDHPAVVDVLLGEWNKEEAETLYVPGVYASSIQFNDSAFEVEVIVDENHINHISFVNLRILVAALCTR